MSITTKTGDGGSTDFLDGSRLSKADALLAATGAVSQPDAGAGAEPQSGAGAAGSAAEIIRSVRDDLFRLVMPGIAGAALPPDTARLEGHIARLEERVARAGFVREWTGPLSVKLNMARTVCRRAERRAVAVNNAAGGQAAGNGAPLASVYLNRLSDLLFLLAVDNEFS
jgi:cob(I)alamin adenosyltransferase